ncbi:MAG: hypothetical protein JNM03_14595 [Sphingopyxis sp.]|jgi:hypothetical protein|uniref:hypothetical protein n=1 Tax=Sphingopyxis sp. TaxID=1908224 RepID=UPI001A49E409|nr:hypothetical protein [Sphingopyxis sp.]MBL9071208.1 hypothetical protein [Sphingopyxis sp.]
MHATPSEAHLYPLIGEELQQICLDPFGVQFKFDRWGLSVEFSIEHIDADGGRYLYNCNAKSGPPLVIHRLLQKSVSAVEREDLAFTLCFEDDSRLIVHTELGPYECGQLYRLSDASGIIVF